MKSELKIRVKSPMIGIKNGLFAEAHGIFPQGESDENNADHGVRTIANSIACTISPFSTIGWLRHGITEYLISQRISVCHSYDLRNTKTNNTYKEYAIQDLKYGYHKRNVEKGKPECEAIRGEQCIVAKIFGGFAGQHRVFSVMPIKVSPVKSHYESGVRNITGRGNYRNIAVSPRSVVDGTPFATHSADIIANVDAILHLKFYNNTPENIDLYTALINQGIEHLNTNYDEFDYQLGGSRTFGCGFIEATLLPPDFTKEETTKYHNLLIRKEDNADNQMKKDDENTKDEQKKANGEIQKKLLSWQEKQKDLKTILDSELKHQKDLFGIDKKWWNQEI